MEGVGGSCKHNDKTLAIGMSWISKTFASNSWFFTLFPSVKANFALLFNLLVFLSDKGEFQFNSDSALERFLCRCECEDSIDYVGSCYERKSYAV